MDPDALRSGVPVGQLILGNRPNGEGPIPIAVDGYGRLVIVTDGGSFVLTQPIQVIGNVASGAADSGNPDKVGGVYRATQPTLADAQRGDVQLDSRANLLVSLGTALFGEDQVNNVIGIIRKPVASAIYAPATDIDAGSVTTKSVKITPGAVHSIYAINKNAAIRYFQLHNKASATGGGDTAQLSFPVAAGSATVPALLQLGADFFAALEYFTTGIAWAWSTTDTTYTAATASDHKTIVRYS